MQAIKDLSRALERLGITGLRARADGRFSLSHDGGRRLDIHPLPDGRLVLEVHLLDLHESVAVRSAQLERALRFSTARMLERHDIVCLSPDTDSLLLQCEVPARAGAAATEHAIERFLNAVDAWSLAVGSSVEAAAFRHARPTLLGMQQP